MGVHSFENTPELLEKYSKALFTGVNDLMKKAALAAGDYIASETPVDTGVARSNWVLTIDSSFGGVIPAYVPYPSYRINHHEAVKQAIFSGRERVRTKVGNPGFKRMPSFTRFRPSFFRGA